MTSKITYQGNLRTEATHIQSGNTIFTDAPLDNHGKGEAFSPTDLVVTALASCMMTIMGITAEKHGFSIEGAHAEVTKVMGINPRRISEINVDIHFTQNYDSKQRKFLEAAARECPVGKSLHPETVQNIKFHY